jgi:mRNA interferase MazF
MNEIKRFEVYQVSLDPTLGSEIAKTRPCVVVSPDEMNIHLATVIVAPLTHTVKGWPSRVPARFAGARGEIALDQLRAVDKRRLIKRQGVMEAKTRAAILTALGEMFAP